MTTTTTTMVMMMDVDKHTFNEYIIWWNVKLNAHGFLHTHSAMSSHTLYLNSESTCNEFPCKNFHTISRQLMNELNFFCFLFFFCFYRFNWVCIGDMQWYTYLWAVHLHVKYVVKILNILPKLVYKIKYLWSNRF